MIVIKSKKGDYTDVVKQMLNIQTGYKLFDTNGNFHPNTDEKHNVYDLDGAVVSCTPSCGFVFVANTSNNDTIVAKLTTAYNEILPMIKDSKHAGYFSTYKSISNGFYTNLMVKPSQDICCVDINSKNPLINSKSNNKQTIVMFSWHVLNITHYPTEFNDMKNASILFNMAVCSILLDTNDIIQCDNYHNITEYSYSMLRSSAMLTDEYIRLWDSDVIIAAEINPNIFNEDYCEIDDEVSFHGKKYVKCDTHYTETRKTLNKNKVFQSSLEQEKISPSHNITTKESIENVCANCYGKMYGRGYVVSINIHNPHDTAGIIVCDMCIHLSSNNLANDYLNNNVVVFPRSIQTAIDESPHSQEKKKIMHELSDKTSNDLYIIKSKGEEFYAIETDTYIGVSDVSSFLYSKKARDNTKQIFELIMP